MRCGSKTVDGLSVRKASGGRCLLQLELTALPGAALALPELHTLDINFDLLTTCLCVLYARGNRLATLPRGHLTVAHAAAALTARQL